MKYAYWLLFPLFVSSSAADADLAPDALKVGYGHYVNLSTKRTADIKQYRLSADWNFKNDIWSMENFLLESYVELGLGYWISELNPTYDVYRIGSKRVNQVSIVPVFRFITKSQVLDSVYPFLDIGVGPSYQDQKDIEQEDLSGINTGGRFQFEMRFFAGVLFGHEQQFEINYGWMHYSNANINDINEGLDFQTLQFGYHF